MPLKKQTFILIFSTLLLVLPFFAEARGLVPCGGDGEAACTVTDIFVLIARVTNFLIGFAGVYAVYELVWGGLWMIIAMGNEESLTREKSRITNAIIGLVMVFMSYMLVNTAVNVILVNKQCQKFDLSNPLNYLKINETTSKCAK